MLVHLVLQALFVAALRVLRDGVGGDIFFHLSDAHDRATDFEEGDSVDFKITYDARKGKDRAVDVKLIESAAVASAGGEEEYDASTMW